MLIYVTKWIHFSDENYDCRILLSILDCVNGSESERTNENVKCWWCAECNYSLLYFFVFLEWKCWLQGVLSGLLSKSQATW